MFVKTLILAFENRLFLSSSSDLDDVDGAVYAGEFPRLKLR